MLPEAQQEVGRLTASPPALPTRAKEDEAKLKAAQDELAASEAARLAAASDLRNAQLCAAQAEASHEARLADMQSPDSSQETPQQNRLLFRRSASL